MYRLWFLMLGCCAVACVADEKPTPAGNRLTIEGWLTSDSTAHELRIGLLAALGSSATDFPENITEVFVEDELGNRYPYTETSEGHYRSEEAFQIVADRSYRLRFNWQGYAYASSYESLIQAPSIEPRIINQESCPEKEAPRCMYAVFARFRDNPNVRNYYRLRMLIHDGFAEPIIEQVFSDLRFNGEEAERNIGPSLFLPESQIELQLWTLSQTNYNYIQSILLQRSSNEEDNILLPLSFSGNISALQAKAPQAIGYFGVADISSLSFSIPAAR